MIKEGNIETFAFNHSVTTNWTMNDYHFHDEFEILFSLSSSTKFFIEDRMYDVKKGDLFILNNMELHKTIAPKDVFYDRYLIMFNPKFLQSYSTPYTDILKCFTKREINFDNRLHLSEDQSLALISLFKKLQFYCTNPTYGADVYQKTTLVEILLLINSFYENIIDKTIAAKTDFKIVEQILEYINQNLNEKLSLDMLSQKFYLSKYYIGHIFKDATGFSVNEYIINKRILKARDLLKQDLSVSDVAEQVGFNNDCHFIRTFKKLVGISPKQYAKKQHQYYLPNIEKRL